MLLVGSEAPVTLRLAVRRAPGSTLDLLTVTAASINVQLPKLTPSPTEEYVYETWTPIVQTSSSELVYLFYSFAGGGVDLPRAGDYGLAVDLTTPSGVIPCLEANLPVSPRHART